MEYLDETFTYLVMTAIGHFYERIFVKVHIFYPYMDGVLCKMVNKRILPGFAVLLFKNLSIKKLYDFSYLRKHNFI